LSHLLISVVKRNAIDQVADYLGSLMDQSIGRQARSAFGEIFGVSGDDAMKVTI
jgi:hypothetical protein